MTKTDDFFNKVGSDQYEYKPFKCSKCATGLAIEQSSLMYMLTSPYSDQVNDLISVVEDQLIGRCEREKCPGLEEIDDYRDWIESLRQRWKT